MKFPRAVPPLLLSSVVVLAACGRGDSGTDAPIGMPADFSPAEKVVRADDQVARCNTIHSLTLPTRMIERLNLQVGPDTAVISCSLQALEEGRLVNVPAQVAGTATALSGNIRQLDFKEVLEEETISYVADFTTEARLGVRFGVTIADPRTGLRHQVDFEQTRI